MPNIQLKSFNKITDSIREKFKSVVLATKTLKLQKVSKNSDNRKLVISTNFLDIINLPEGTAVTECVLDHNQGIEVVKANGSEKGIKKIYGRNYKNRNTNRESQIDMRSQAKINKAFGHANEVRVIFTHEKVTIKPIFEPSARTSDKSLELNIHNEDGLYVGILAAIRLIKENMFPKVTSVISDHFAQSQEFILFSMQLRRLGYNLSINENTLTASHPTAININSTIEIDTSSYIGKQAIKKTRINTSQPLSSFVVCTAGVDIYGMEKQGFNVSSILSYRPPESRDFTKSTCNTSKQTNIKHNDKTESNIIVAAMNTNKPKHLINEDIYKFNSKHYKEHLGEHNFIHVSLECSCFSNLKTIKERMRFIESLESTRDMFFNSLDIIEELNIPTALIENVKAFTGSVESRLFNYRLKELGYSIKTETLNALDHQGLSNRERSFTFASKLGSDFTFPEKTESAVNVWDEIIETSIDELRNVTHTSSVKKAITTGRLRTIKQGSKHSPCFTRSQLRQAKDSVYALINGEYFMPSISMMRDIMGIDKGFDLSFVSKELSSEIIGQSVCLKMHKRILSKVKSHINGYVKSITQPNKRRSFAELLFSS